MFFYRRIDLPTVSILLIQLALILTRFSDKSRFFQCNPSFTYNVCNSRGVKPFLSSLGARYALLGYAFMD